MSAQPSSKRPENPQKEIPEIIQDRNRPNKKYERGKFLGKVANGQKLKMSNFGNHHFWFYEIQSLDLFIIKS